MRAKGSAALTLFVALVIAVGIVPAFADPGFGYTTINPPPGGEKSHKQIFENIYGGNFTASGKNYSNGSITAKRVYDFDDIVYNTTHVYNHEPNDVDQIWTDGQVTVTAIAKYASYQQAFGWNGDNGLGTVYHPLVDDQHLNQPVSFTIVGGQEFLWGYQAKGNPRCDWWHDGENLEWWSRPESQHHCVGEDHMVTYFMQGASPTQTVWTIFMEDVRLYESDKDYNDFVVEIRAVPEPTSILLLGLGALALLRKRKA